MLHVVMSWTKSKHAGWSYARCPHCQDLEALRVHDEIRVVALLFVPVGQRVIGQKAICDFCERAITLPPAGRRAELQDWKASDGRARLFQLLAPGLDVSLPDPSNEIRLRSLLSATESMTALRNISLTRGLVIGGLAGAFVGVPAGVMFFKRGIQFGAPDLLGTVFGAIGILGTLGGLTGAILQGVGSRSRIASRKITSACRDYLLDRPRLARLSRDYHVRVQHAVDEALLD